MRRLLCCRDSGVHALHKDILRMNDTTFLIIIAIAVFSSLFGWTQMKRFRENREREQKKPETYHFT